jgi:hypothetical protein
MVLMYASNYTVLKPSLGALSSFSTHKDLNFRDNRSKHLKYFPLTFVRRIFLNIRTVFLQTF